MRGVRGTWKAIDVSPAFNGVSSHTVTAVSPGVVIICGGEDGPRTLVPATRSLWKYEKEVLSLIPQEEAHVVTLLGHCSFCVKGQLHVCKQMLWRFHVRVCLNSSPSWRKAGQWGKVTDLWSFEEKKGWTVVDTHGSVKPAPRSYHAGTSTGHFLFIFGGCSGHSRLNDLWRFDTKSSHWEQLHAGGEGTDRPSVRGGAMLFAPSEKEVYVICGFSGKELEDAWKFDVEKKTWTPITSHLPARSVAACANLNGKAFIFGGERDPGTEDTRGRD
jgi:hypothetical protein